MNIGKHGENLAVEYLERNGYDIIARNFRCRVGEIDIVARDRAHTETIVILEIKTRKTFHYGLPCESINDEKKKRVKKAAEIYAACNNQHTSGFRLDVIEILLMNGKTYIKHIKNAF